MKPALLAKWRAKNKKTPKQMANFFGVSQKRYLAIEAGKHPSTGKPISRVPWGWAMALSAEYHRLLPFPDNLPSKKKK